MKVSSHRIFSLSGQSVSSASHYGLSSRAAMKLLGEQGPLLHSATEPSCSSMGAILSSFCNLPFREKPLQLIWVDVVSLTDMRPSETTLSLQSFDSLLPRLLSCAGHLFTFFHERESQLSAVSVSKHLKHLSQGLGM